MCDNVFQKTSFDAIFFRLGICFLKTTCSTKHHKRQKRREGNTSIVRVQLLVWVLVYLVFIYCRISTHFVLNGYNIVLPKTKNCFLVHVYVFSRIPLFMPTGSGVGSSRVPSVVLVHLARKCSAPSGIRVLKLNRPMAWLAIQIKRRLKRQLMLVST